MKVRRSVVMLGVCAVCLPIAIFGGVAWRDAQRKREFWQSLAALQRGDARRAAESIEDLRLWSGFETHYRILRCALLIRSGDHDVALAELSRLKPEGEFREPVLLLTGECLYWRDRLGEAESIFRQVVQEREDSAQAHRWLGAIYFDLGAFPLAAQHLERLAALVPTDYSPHRLLGLMAHDFEDDLAAIGHYQKALGLAPPTEVRQEILRELALSLIRQHQYDAAQKLLQGATTDAYVLALQAECFWATGQREHADKTLDRARLDDPDQRSVLLLQARVALDDNQPEAALEPLQRAVAANPHDAECRYQLALTYRKLGRTSDAEVEMQRRQVSDELRQRLSDLNHQANREPYNAEVRAQLADVCQQLGKHNLAVMWQKAAAACRPAARR